MTKTRHSATLLTAASMARVFCRDHIENHPVCVTAEDLDELAKKFAAIENDDDLRELIYEYDNNPHFDRHIATYGKLIDVIVSLVPSLAGAQEG